MSSEDRLIYLVAKAHYTVPSEEPTDIALSEAYELIAELRRHGVNITSGGKEPEIRVRISHAHTLKDGWRCDSTTVEWTGHVPPDWEAIDSALSAAHGAGRDEAIARNEQDGAR